MVRNVGSIVLAVLVLCARAAFAQTLTTAGTPGLLRINTAVAGSEPIAVSTSGGTYTLTTPTPNRTYAITGQVNANLPTGVTLTVSLAAPGQGSVSLGAVALDVTGRNLVTGIRKNMSVTQSITYQLSATAAAGVVPLSSRTVTLTIIQYP
jgi:hypothetical protein